MAEKKTADPAADTKENAGEEQQDQGNAWSGGADQKKQGEGENKEVAWLKKEIAELREERRQWKAEKEQNEKEKADAEAKKLEEKGEYEKLKTWYESKIEELTGKVENLTSREERLLGIANAQIDKVKEQYGDKFEKITNIIWSEDPLVILEKLPSVTELIPTEQKGTKWGSRIPNGWGTDEMTALQEKMRNGSATHQERNTLRKMLAKKKYW